MPPFTVPELKLRETVVIAQYPARPPVDIDPLTGPLPAQSDMVAFIAPPRRPPVMLTPLAEAVLLQPRRLESPRRPTSPPEKAAPSTEPLLLQLKIAPTLVPARAPTPELPLTVTLNRLTLPILEVRPQNPKRPV
jgi:hypothetical protein